MGSPRDAEWLDAQLERLAIESGAEPVQAPATIARGVLERCGHFESFPGLAIPCSPSEFYTPAACYHVYSTLEGRRLRAPHVLTLVATCGRNESLDSPALARDGVQANESGRLRHFRMREVVFLGEPEWVSRARAEWMDRASNFASTCGLAVALEAATDTFWGDPGRGRRLIQQLKALKYELRAHAGDAGALAIASFNLHESFFTSRFDIRMADGSPAVSGCAAFGLERWMLACDAQRNGCLR